MADTIPLSDVLRQISDELLLAEAYSKRRGDAVMQFQAKQVPESFSRAWPSRGL
jgi:hypothetical protein